MSEEEPFAACCMDCNLSPAMGEKWRYDGEGDWLCPECQAAEALLVLAQRNKDG